MVLPGAAVSGLFLVIFYMTDIALISFPVMRGSEFN